MKLAILNGSPKGDLGVTLQYVKFIQKHHPEHDYVYHNISSRILGIEKKADSYDRILSDIGDADAIIWATPVYTLFVPAQLMRFIELVHERGGSRYFNGKPTAVITTSIHFYDHTAHRYMNAVCDDLDLNYLGFFSAEMDDIRTDTGRNRLLVFAKSVFNSIENRVTLPKRFAPVAPNPFQFVPDEPPRKIDPKNRKITIVTDTKEKTSNTSRMIQRFSASFSGPVDLVNLWDLTIKGGCLGCIRCGFDNKCAYEDDFGDFYRSRVMSADIVVFAPELTHRNLSWKFKTFFDRRFFMNHAPDMRGKQVAFLVSGPTGQLPYMQDFFQGAIEWQDANLLGVVQDDIGSSQEINQSIQHIAETAVTFSEAGYTSPVTFLGVGGAKIFRDDIWGKLRYVFQADYTTYKKHGLFDFPHKNYKSRMQNQLIRLLTKIPQFRKEFYKRAKTIHGNPHRKAVARH